MRASLQLLIHLAQQPGTSSDGGEQSLRDLEINQQQQYHCSVDRNLVSGIFNQVCSVRRERPSYSSGVLGSTDMETRRAQIPLSVPTVWRRGPWDS